MLMMTLDDAVNVMRTRFPELAEYGEVIRNELEQKCYINAVDQAEAFHRLSDLSFDINPAEIAYQIQQDHLSQWCHTMQVEIALALVKLPLKENDK